MITGQQASTARFTTTTAKSTEASARPVLRHKPASVKNRKSTSNQQLHNARRNNNVSKASFSSSSLSSSGAPLLQSSSFLNTQRKTSTKTSRLFTTNRLSLRTRAFLALATIAILGGYSSSSSSTTLLNKLGLSSSFPFKPSSTNSNNNNLLQRLNPNTRTRTAASTTGDSGLSNHGTPTPTNPINLAVLAPLDQPSSLHGASWREVLQHMSTRLQWTNPDYRLTFYNTADLNELKQNSGSIASLSDIVVAFAVKETSQVEVVVPILALSKTSVAVDSDQSLSLAARVKGINIPLNNGNNKDTSNSSGSDSNVLRNWIDSVRIALSPEAKHAQHHKEAVDVVQQLYDRRSSDDLLLSFLVLINEAVRTVPEVANSTKRADAGLPELVCMISKCGSEIFGCVTDTICKTALDCLNSCSFNDQVCSYRCIASYESPQLEAFSLCILQKHNCLGLSAQIPEIPDPKPMDTFRGSPLTHEMAEDLFVGWYNRVLSSLRLPRSSSSNDNSNSGGATSSSEIKGEPFSWRVIGGKNAAYDAFPCQFQLFFPGKARNSFWYYPVFKVKTLDGQEAWRKRLYRVRRDKIPGSFRLSVLDNGVTSLEHWRVLDCDEDLEWCAFYYSGAAGAAGLSYTGSIITSRTGRWPEDPKAVKRIEDALDRAGIKPWELSTVDNSSCEEPPLTPPDVAALIPA